MSVTTGRNNRTGVASLWGLGLPVAIALFIFAPILFGGRTLFPTDITNQLILPFAAGQAPTNVQETALSDYVLYYYPVRHFQASVFRSGHLNLWNPYIFGGQPAFANNGSIVAFDPFNAPILWLDLPSALAWRSFLEAIACMAFMYLYLRHLALGAAACLVGSIGYGLNSMFWANAFDWSIGGMLWLPLLCLLLDRAIAAPSARRVASTGVVMGIALLASPLQIYIYLCCGVSALLGLQWLFLRRDWRSLKVSAIVGACVLVIGIGMTAVQMLPAIELYSHSARFAEGPLRATTRPMRSVRHTAIATAGLASFVFPNLAGRMKESMVVSGVLWNGETHWQGFIGIVPFFLAGIGVWAGVDRRRIPYAVLAIAVVVTLLYTPLGPVLYDRFFLLYIFCASVAAALGCSALCRSELVASRSTQAVRVLAAFVGAVVVIIGIVNVALAVAADRIASAVDAKVASTLATNYFGASYPALYIQKAHHYLDDLKFSSPHTAVPLAIALSGLVLIALRIGGRLSGSAFARIAVALTTVDLVFMTVSHLSFVDMNRYPFTPASPAIALIQKNIGLHRVISFRALPEPPVLPLGLASTYGIESADGYDNLGPPNLSQLLSFSGRPCGTELCVDPGNTDVTNVKYVLTGPHTRLAAERFDLAYDREIRVYENRSPMDRAFWVSSYEIVPETGAAISRVRSPSFDPRATVILDKEPELSVRGPGGAATVRVTERTPLTVTLRVDAGAAGLAVISDTYYPGWQAFLDDKAVPILRANGVMRAVAVPAGFHEVTFAYAPQSFKTGAIVSLLSLSGALGVALLGRKSTA